MKLGNGGNDLSDYVFVLLLVVHSDVGRPLSLDGVQPERHCVGRGQERHEGPLLQLVAQDGRVGLPGGADGEAGRCVTNGDRQAGLGADLAKQKEQINRF